MYAQYFLLALPLMLGLGCNPVDPTDTNDVTDTGDTNDTPVDTGFTPADVTVSLPIAAQLMLDGDEAKECVGEVTDCVVKVTGEGQHEITAVKDGYRFVAQTFTVEAGGKYNLTFDSEGQFALEIRNGIYEGYWGEREVEMDEEDGMIVIKGLGVTAFVTDQSFYGELDNGSFVEGEVISNTEIYYTNTDYTGSSYEDTITYARAN